MDVTAKRPAYQWYPGDFRRDTAVQACSFEARALWREMLDLMHDGEPYGHLTAGGVPVNALQLARIAGVPPAKVARWLAELEERKVFSRTEAGVIYSRRMVKDEHNRTVRAAGGPKSQGHPNVPVARPERKGRRITRRIPSARPSPDPSLDPSGDPSGYPLQFAVAVAVKQPQQHPTADAVGPAGKRDTSPSPDPVPPAVDPPKQGGAAKYPHFPPDECARLHACWLKARGAVDFGRFRKTLAPLYQRDGPLFTEAQLVNAIEFHVLRSKQAGGYEWRNCTPESFVANVQENVRLGGMFSTDETGEFTERGRLLHGGPV